MRADIEELAPAAIGRLNAICAHALGPSAPWFEEAVKDSATVCTHAAAMGRRVFGAFCDGRAVGRAEVMPIDSAPLPLEGEGLQVIRCLWVVKEAQGSGIARDLMQRALAAAEGAKGVAIVTSPGWNDVPAPFLVKFGFATVQQKGLRRVLLRRARADARVALADIRRETVVSRSRLHVEAAVSGMCPAAIQYYRRLLDAARRLSDKVVTKERIVGNRADAFRFGSENSVYIDGEEPLSGPFRTAAFCDLVKERLSAK